MVPTDLLRQVGLFRGLNREEIDVIATLTAEWECPKGQTIFKEGDDSQVMYIVKQGEIAIQVSAGLLINHTIATMGEGDVFGELAFIDRSPRTATVRCTKRSILISFNRDDFNRIGQDYPNIQRVILKNIARTLADRLRNANLKMKEMAGRDKSLVATWPQQLVI